MQTKPNLLAILPVVWLQIWSEIFAWMWWKKQWRQVKHAKHIETYRNRLKQIENTSHVLKAPGGWWSTWPSYSRSMGEAMQVALTNQPALNIYHSTLYIWKYTGFTVSPCFTDFIWFHTCPQLPPAVLRLPIMLQSGGDKDYGVVDKE